MPPRTHPPVPGGLGLIPRACNRYEHPMLEPTFTVDPAWLEIRTSSPNLQKLFSFVNLRNLRNLRKDFDLVGGFYLVYSATT